MRRPSYPFVIVICYAALITRLADAQEPQSVVNTRVTVMPETVEQSVRLAKLIEAHQKAGKVLSLKDLRYYYGDNFHESVAISLFENNANTPATKSDKPNKSKSRIMGVVVGGAIGALTGLLLNEMADAALDDLGPCNEGDPGCTSDKGYSRTGLMLIFGGVGVVIGLAVAG